MRWLLNQMTPSPNMAYLYWPMAGFVAFTAAVSFLPTASPPQPQQPARTAEWFAAPANDAERVRVILHCRANPAEARSSADCAAAWQSNILVAERDARRALGGR